MIIVKILGTGCPSCKATANLVEEVAAVKGVPITVQKVEEVRDIMRYGVLTTPGVVIDELVVHAGGIPARSKVEGWLDAVAKAPVT